MFFGKGGHMESNTIRLINENKIIVIVRGVQSDKLIRLAEAMYDGGIRLIEITYSADGSIADRETANNIRSLTKHFGDDMCIGAGTVLTLGQAELTKEAGGKFIISPDTVPEVIKKTKEMRMISIPGALTPSEITLAHRSGADFVKIFPAVNLGTEYIKAIKAPLSHIRLLAVGGVNNANMADYLKAGVCGFGIGSNIVDKKMITNNDFKGITELAKKYVAAINGD